ncbi:hypothetical protein CALVIDRAFT_600880 [Calocera viscosa TUFC12733]|uniref:Uncharacterized protein n=1 Tax=Calocera viscosa (strain TUFC12733) TaxID=1330018 RepID=A0A167J2P0_CALVF|nr:hypothetical protein CALVIDRAFT_600880 [Calocera viscosa TUFC12733]
MSASKLVFYDLLCGTPNTCWSPSCWRTRLVLQHKRIPFDTVWVSYPDIASTVGHTQPGRDPVTLPVIKNGDTWVYDSWEIFLYLEQHFPSTEEIPSLIYPNVEAVYFFENWTHAGPVESLILWILPRMPAFLDESGREFFVRTREDQFGSLEEMAEGQQLEQAEGGFEPIEFLLKRYGPYIAGERVSYQDFVLLATLQWFDMCEPGCVRKIVNFFPTGHFARWYGMLHPLAVTQ